MLKNAIESMKRYWHDSIKLWILRKTKFESRERWWSEKCKPWILENRTYSLFRAGLIGIVFALIVYWIFCALDNYVLHGSLTILALGLPTFFVLWLFRTHDVQRQIDKTEENINNSTFVECERILIGGVKGEKDKERESSEAKIALEQLAYLKRETNFDEKRIGLITQGIDLDRMHLEDARLSGLDLSGAYLRNTHLEGADLSETNLSGADLSDADLSDANLQGANLSNFIDNAKDKNKWHLAAFDGESNFDGTWLEDIEVRFEIGMIPMKRDESE